MSRFFPASKLITKRKLATFARCGSCGLYKTCKSPKMPHTGTGRKKVLIVAEAPDKIEDFRNEQLVGDADKKLKQILQRQGINLNVDCWKTNAIICRPPKNREPSDDEIQACRPNLIRTIRELKPNVIILLGKVAVKSLLGWLWEDGIHSMEQWVGWQIPCQDINVWVCPTYHPSYILRNPKDMLLANIFEKHLVKAFKIKDKPWRAKPNYEDKIDVILKTYKAQKIIRQLKNGTKAVAFDYETNCLKPETPGSEIVSCSVCFDGKVTIAFPFTGVAIDAVKELLCSPVLKIASNMKFEHRWSWHHLGIKVKGWYWDTMLAAHVLDNRSGITGLKFQSFVQLGMPDYNSHIEPLLRVVEPTPYNQIHEISMQDLLLYNGLDSLLEYEVAMKQIKKMQM